MATALSTVLQEAPDMCKTSDVFKYIIKLKLSGTELWKHSCYSLFWGAETFE